MSYITAAKAEVSEGDELEVWAGELPGTRPHGRLFRVKILYSQLAPPLSDGRVQVILTCDVVDEVPEWVVEQIRHPTPSEPSPRWWRRRAKVEK